MSDRHNFNHYNGGRWCEYKQNNNNNETLSFDDNVPLEKHFGVNLSGFDHNFSFYIWIETKKKCSLMLSLYLHIKPINTQAYTAMIHESLPVYRISNLSIYSRYDLSVRRSHDFVSTPRFLRILFFVFHTYLSRPQTQKTIMSYLSHTHTRR